MGYIKISMEPDGAKKRIPNPKQNAGFLSSATFLWVLPILKNGRTWFQCLDDLYEPLPDDASRFLGEQMERAWNKEKERAKKHNKKKPSLLNVFFRIHKKDIIVSGIMIFAVEFIFRLLTPLCLIEFIEFFDSAKKYTSSIKMFYMSAAGLVLGPFICVFLNHAYHMKVFHVGMKLRVAISSLIFRKTLSLNRSALNEVSTGHIVNLLSNDAGRFDFIGSFFFDILIGPFQIIIVGYCLMQIVGISCLIGIATIVLSIPVTVWLGKKISVMRMETAMKTDERVRIMSEIVVGIKVIKMYVWEQPFEKLVEIIRRSEVAVIRRVSYIRGFLYSFPMFHTRTSIFLTLIMYAQTGNVITASKAFVLSSFFNILQLTVADYFPQGASQVSEFLISLKRIEKFLLMDNEIDNKTEDIVGNNISAQDTELHDNDHSGIALSKVCVKRENEDKNWLDNISLEIKHGELTAIIGSVGAGKSSLFYTILKEVQMNSGSMELSGKLSFAPQEPWLFPGTIKQNILFGEKYVEDKFNKVIKACALDKDIDGLVYRERTLVGERGVTLSGGQKARISLARAIYKSADIYLLDDPLSAVDANVQKHLFEKCIKGLLKEKVVLLITHQVQYLQHVKKIVAMENGSIKCIGNYEDLLESGFDFSSYLKRSERNSEIMIESPTLSAKMVEEKLEEDRPDVIDENEVDEKMKGEEINKKKMDMNVFWTYFIHGGNYCVLFFLIIIFLAAQVVASGGDYWTSYWVNLEDHVFPDSTLVTSNNILDIYKYYPTRKLCLYIFTFFIISNIMLSIFRSAFFFSICMKASQKLHDKMFTAISRSPLIFFNDNPSGRILNRFSKDVGNVDEILPSGMVSCLQIFLSAVGVFSVVPSTNPWLLIPTFAMISIFYVLRQFYLSASCTIKRIEGIARSPVYTHLNSSLHGLTTIHALQAEPVIMKEFDYHQDRHSASWYTFIAGGRAISLWLDIICALYNALVTISFLFLKSSSFGGNVGLAITQTTALTSNLQWGMRQSADVENQMTSVERILEYTQLKKEHPLESTSGKKPSDNWPMHGRIIFKNVFLRYSPKNPWILNDISFTILPSQKVGVVGRTGAGKSSLIAALFKLFEIKGCIKIDDIEIDSIGLWDLRSKISVIPQDPVLFTGTLKYNLDPFGQFSDTELWKALEEVELQECVMNLKKGLQTEVLEGGSNFSVGQRQLISLARAIVRGNKILVLDEPTANVDTRTDFLIQKTIRNKFRHCTVITIAHRLNSIMDSDKVMVMDFGRLVEFAPPFILLQNKSGHLYELAEQSGYFSDLYAIAAQRFSGNGSDEA